MRERPVTCAARIVVALVPVALCVAACGCLAIAESGLPEAVDLGIADVAWDSGRPDLSVGWCAEASIHVALAYYGIEKTQLEIYRARNPDHADLYAYEIDLALETLGVCTEAWPESQRDLTRFIDWIRHHIADGTPVLCGVKPYPDEHPEWSLDHFVLVVGYDQAGLIKNTQLDMDGQIHVQYVDLASTECSYAFANRQSQYFGRAILGLCEE